MRFQTALINTIALALFAKALPNGRLADDFGDELIWAEVEGVEGTSDLPEGGQVVFAPMHIDTDGFELFDNEGNMDAAIFDDWKNQVVKQHNDYRYHYSAPPLTWSDALYPGTQQWANQCKFQHSNGQGKYGENLAAGTGGSYGFSDGLKAWMDEASKYDWNHPGFSSATGHFTQVVWKSSKQVACAIANCRGGTIFQQPSKYVVCRYSPAGNFAGRYADNVGRYRK